MSEQKTRVNLDKILPKGKSDSNKEGKVLASVKNLFIIKNNEPIETGDIRTDIHGDNKKDCDCVLPTLKLLASKGYLIGYKNIYNDYVWLVVSEMTIEDVKGILNKIKDEESAIFNRSAMQKFFKVANL